jgi:hypothetical protein
MNRWLWGALLIGGIACGETINGGNGSPDGGDGAIPLDQTPSCSPPCAARQMCIGLPGSPTTFCGNACQSDHDCPAFLICRNGACLAACSPSSSSGCAAGEYCAPAVSAGGECTSNTDCSFGSYCDSDAGTSPGMGGCESFSSCAACRVGTCPVCTANSQCGAGQVCADGTCQTCTSDGQCGPNAQCTPTHTAFECTCSDDSDCDTHENCQSGVCASAGCHFSSDGGDFREYDGGCHWGQACKDDMCVACSTIADCYLPGSPSSLGYTCVHGTCTSCSTNSDCGGGQTCVQGSCGTCVASSQCGPSGNCVDGYCTCTSDDQCADAQRCGAGVCVAM